MTANSPVTNTRFCSECGTTLNSNAKFCHACGASVHGGVAAPSSASSSSAALRWGVPGIALVGLIVLSIYQFSSRGGQTTSSAGTPLGAMQAPDISSMTPEERADRLYDRVMRLSSEGKADSAAFFGPMALGAIEALSPLNAHRRYDMGVVSLVMGDAAVAKAQSDTILKQLPNHLLGLSLAARAADARKDAVAAKGFRRRLLAAEAAERARGLPEYTDHDGDIRTAVELARKP